MKISTKGRYALRMLLDLAEHQQDGFIALKDIASRLSLAWTLSRSAASIATNASRCRCGRDSARLLLIILTTSPCRIFSTTTKNAASIIIRYDATRQFSKGWRFFSL